MVNYSFSVTGQTLSEMEEKAKEEAARFFGERPFQLVEFSVTEQQADRLGCRPHLEAQVLAYFDDVTGLSTNYSPTT